jgi:hypothetical protein
MRCEWLELSSFFGFPGNTSTLSACVYCYNLFHLTCHRVAVEEMRERENICPICYKKKQQDKTAAVAQLKIDGKDSFTVFARCFGFMFFVFSHLAEKRQRARQHADLTDLWNKYDNLEKKLHMKNEEKKRLLHEGRRTKQKIQHLLSIVEKFSKTDEEPEPVDQVEPEQTDDVTPAGSEKQDDVASDVENEVSSIRIRVIRSD